MENQNWKPYHCNFGKFKDAPKKYDEVMKDEKYVNFLRGMDEKYKTKAIKHFLNYVDNKLGAEKSL